MGSCAPSLLGRARPVMRLKVLRRYGLVEWLYLVMYCVKVPAAVCITTT